MSEKSGWPALRIITAAGIVLFCAAFLVPFAGFFHVSLSNGGPLGEAAGTVLPSVPMILTFTAGQAALSSLSACLLALPGAFFIARYAFPLKRFFLSLSLIPFVLPSIIVVICMISMYGKSGLINDILGTDFNLIYNFGGIILAHVFYNFSLAMRIISDGWKRIGNGYAEAAKSLGDGKPGTFFRITLPLLAPSIATAFFLIFVYCFMSFGVVLVFGGARFSTFETEIFREMYVRLDLPAAALFALVQLVISIGFIMISSRITRRNSPDERRIRHSGEPDIRTAPIGMRVAGGLYAIFVIVFISGPLAAMIYRAFTPGGAFSLESFEALFNPGSSLRNVESILRSSVPGVIRTSLALACTSGALTFLMATAAAFTVRRKRNLTMESLFQIPMGISSVTMGLGLRMLYGTSLPFLPLVVAGQVLTAFPFVFRIVKTVADNLQESFLESSRILGSSPAGTFFRVTLPLSKRGLLNGLAYSLAIPFADFTMVVSISYGELTTFPVAIYRLIGFRSFDLALSMSVLYIAVCLVLFFIIDLTSGERIARNR